MQNVLKVRPKAVEWREIEGEVVALDVRSSVYFALNRTAAALWPELLEGTTRERLLQRLQDAFGIDRSRAEADLEGFLRSLAAQDLLEPAADATQA